jgi:RepB DNA-primase from phage plasmid
MTAETTRQRSFVDAPTYIKDNFEPNDKIALLVLNRQNKESLQRITTADKASSPEFQAWLRYRASRGDEIYVGMNALKPEAWARTKDQIATIRHLYVDLDHGGERAVEAMRNSGLVPDPNYLLNTSPDKHQIVWKVDGIAPEQAEALQRAMVREFGGDPAATDSTRVLRLPTFANRKYHPPHMVTARAEASQTYHLDDFKLRTDAHGPSYERQSSEHERNRPAEEITQSERDWAFAKRALARGDDPEEVIRRIMDYRGDEKHPNYARYTVEKAKTELPRASTQAVAGDSRRTGAERLDVEH